MDGEPSARLKQLDTELTNGPSDDSESIRNICRKYGTVEKHSETTGDEQYMYGWYSCTPKCLQKLNRPQWLLVSLGFYAFMQGLIINGMINVVISTLEKRFELTSTTTGLIASTYDIATASLVVFVGYYGGRGHKARWIGFGCVIMAVGSVVFALPHFTTGRYSSRAGSVICVENSSDECQRSTSASLSNYLYVFILAQVLHGIGCTPLYSLGVTLIDESVSVGQSALYLGIFYGIAAVGPGAGYIIGGALLSIYTDILTDSVDLNPTDPGWIGAWWLGFITAGTIAFFVAVPVSGFPKEFKETQTIRSNKVCQAHTTSSGHSDDVTHPDFGQKLSDFPQAIKYLVTNPPFVFLTLAACFEGVLVSGFSTFGPKILETQFRKTASDSSFLMGICTIPGVGLGYYMGGYLVRRWNLTVRGMIKFCCFASLIAQVMLFGMFVRCPQEDLVGVNVDFGGNITTTSSKMLANECNSGCGCTQLEFNPVCGDNGLEYFDSCFAGCTTGSNGAESFSDCACLSLSGANTSSTVTSGKCPTDCNYLPIYLVSILLLMVFHFLSSIPGLSAVLRCVPESQRSLAVGVQWIFIRALGTIPGPILFGAAFDTSCLIWQEDCEGNQGTCFLYNGKSVSWKFFLLGFVFSFLALVCFLLALLVYKSPEMDGDSKKNDTKPPANSALDVTQGNDTITGLNIRPSLRTGSQINILANENLPAIEAVSDHGSD